MHSQAFMPDCILYKISCIQNFKFNFPAQLQFNCCVLHYKITIVLLNLNYFFQKLVSFSIALINTIIQIIFLTRLNS